MLSRPHARLRGSAFLNWRSNSGGQSGARPAIPAARCRADRRHERRRTRASSSATTRTRGCTGEPIRFPTPYSDPAYELDDAYPGLSTGGAGRDDLALRGTDQTTAGTQGDSELGLADCAGRVAQRFESSVMHSAPPEKMIGRTSRSSSASTGRGRRAGTARAWRRADDPAALAPTCSASGGSRSTRGVALGRDCGSGTVARSLTAWREPDRRHPARGLSDARRSLGLKSDRLQLLRDTATWIERRWE